MPQPPVFLAGHAELQQDLILLTGAEGRHAAAVRRMRPGERADVADGAGLVAECVVAGASSQGLELAVQARRAVPRPDPSVTVVQAIPKGDRGELAVEEMTEVGVDRIMPWAAARSVAVWRAERGARSLARWRATAREAAKQSRRAWIPEVTEPVTASDVAAVITSAASAMVLEPGAEHNLGQLSLPESGGLVLIVGPEGGITDEEGFAFRSAGATPVRLGPTVLRTSTAGPVAVAILLSRSARWS
jgi:16S rRNA (uracil1498-N3)-methyltransferase